MYQWIDLLKTQAMGLNQETKVIIYNRTVLPVSES